MSVPADMNEYLRGFGRELADRILQSFPPLQSADGPASPLLSQLLRKPYPAQAIGHLGWPGAGSRRVRRP